ncbi:ATP-binding protein [Ignavibacterium sp.]|uniref:ATP-binding protein n=1 Tax=Ignavibacterium sp. TaxID=2651167 RepID=UPI0022023700|nr:ATP-binding protein [Ignavibacterium sp.]BDQ02729.1 MAG: two-component sensor histidine kinase [Ignavibacterium sp.]
MKVTILNKLSTRLILIFLLIFIITISVYSFYTIKMIHENLGQACTQNAYNISDVIKKSTRYGMLLNSREHVEQIINTIATEKGVMKIRIFNKNGMIAYSSDSTELKTIVDLEHTACNSCHSIKPIPTTLPVKDLINKSEGSLVLVNPIINEQACYTADCHAHKSTDKLLGIISVQMSTETVDSIINQSTNIFISGVIATFILLVIATIFTIRYSVNKPLRKIFVGIQEIGKGNLDYRIELNRSDELGLMAKEFNSMTAKLKSAYDEIKDWNENLNKKVEQKNQELKNIYEQIVQVEKLASLGKLSATVAHELNNPLEGILTYSKLVTKKLEKFDDKEKYDEIIKILQLIADESSRCGRIVKDLLQFSHQDEIQFVHSSIKDVINRALKLMSHHFQINNVTIKTDFKVDDIYVECDAQRIEQALIAILVNAVEAMPEGGTITVSLAQEMDNAVIRISDEGKGIPPEILPHIFEPFFTTKDKVKDTGLGLAVVYGIIQQHGGKVFVEQTSIKGTTFKISLPINHSKQNGKETQNISS